MAFHNSAKFVGMAILLADFIFRPASVDNLPGGARAWLLFTLLLWLAFGYFAGIATRNGRDRASSLRGRGGRC